MEFILGAHVRLIRNAANVLHEWMRDKAGQAFADDTATDFGPKYLELLYANWFEIVRSARKAVFLAVVLVLSFFLLDPGKTGTLKLGPLETNNASAVLALIPAIASYLIFEAIDLTLSAAYYRESSRAVMQKLFPGIWKNDFDLYLEPPTTYIWGGGSSFAVTHGQSDWGAAKFLKNATTLSVYLIWAAALAFLIYAYLTLFEDSKVSCVVLVASLVFTLFNVIRAGVQILIVGRDMNSRRD